MRIAEVQGSAQPPTKKAASLIKKETDEHRTSNVQHRIMYSVCFKKDFAKPPARKGSNAYASESDSILRHSSFDIRYPAVRCLIQATVAGSLIIRKTVPFWCSFIRARPPAKKQPV
jgi:hypothetical protein